MKKWNTPAIETLDLTNTAHNWTGIYRDGGYIGDGEISGHLSWDKPTAAPTATQAPTDATSTPDILDKLS